MTSQLPFPKDAISPVRLPNDDAELYSMGRAVDAQYCEDYANSILKILDAKPLRPMSDEQWKELADCLHKARCMLEHAHDRVIPNKTRITNK